MILTIASGKGGTGKTTVAASLALSLAAEMSPPPLFLDCDVEAPNAHLFLAPRMAENQVVNLLIPVIDQKKCSLCGKCAEICQYHALVLIGDRVLLFPELCHGCGSCTAMCPEAAIQETPDPMGVIERGPALAGVTFARGVMNVGEPMPVPVIRQLLAWAKPEPDQVILRDAPPGTSCPVVATAHGSDFLLLVTEATPFGLHDLRLAVQVANELGIPAGVIINRETGAYPPLEAFCTSQRLPVLMRIPFERAIAEGIARGQTLIDIHPEYAGRFRQMFAQIIESCKPDLKETS